MGNSKNFIKDLEKFGKNKESLGGKRILRPIDIEDGMIFMYDEILDAFRAILMPQGSDVLFRDSRPIPQDIGGYKKGDMINNVPLSEVVRNILYPYVPPKFSSFSISGIPPLQIGDTAGTCTFNWTLSDTKTVSANSIQILKNGSPILSGLSNSPTNTDLDIRYDVPKKEIFTIVGTNTKGETFSMSTQLTWDIPIYFGVSTKESVTENDIEDMAELLVCELESRTFGFIGAGYKYIAIPTQLINKTPSFKDAVTKFDVPMKPVYDFKIVHNKSNIENSYTLYRSFYFLNGDITITII